MMRRLAFRLMVVGAGFFFLTQPITASAVQGQPPPQPSSLQQSSGAYEIPVRLRYLEGTVTVQRAAAGETEAATANLPLGTGDRVWSSGDGRVELMFEDGTSIWMAADTTLDMVSMRRPGRLEAAILRLWTGSIFVHRPVPESGELLPFRVDAPAGAVRADEPGLFRIDLDDDQSVWLSAYDGAATLVAGGLTERVVAGQRTLAQFGSAPAQAVAFNTADSDAFASWRDERTLLYASSHRYVRDRDYVPETIVHYASDLEPYGSWSYHPTYRSWYWKPFAAVSWSPYRHGRWVYTYGGWSWVPAASWGYVTTHYGRWHHSSYGGWMWFPGRVWTPASVHWYVGPRHVGWVPLNYYGRPAVSFGVHLGGGGLGLSVGISNHYGYYPYDPWYGYGGRYGYGGYHGFGGHYGYGGHYSYGFDRGRRFNRPIRYAGRSDNTVGIGPIGSASGGRVVKNLGYSSGAAEAWTVVRSEDFENRSVGRVAVARSALPRGLDQSSKTLLSGRLRARNPRNLTPRSGVDETSTRSTRRAVPRGSSQVRAGARHDSGDVLAPGAQRRPATRRIDNASLGKSGVGTTNANGARRRAVPTTSRAQRNAANGATAVPSRRATTAPQGQRAPSARSARRVVGRSSAAAQPSKQRVNGAVRRTTNPPTARARTPTPRSSISVRPSVPTRSAPTARRAPARPSRSGGSATSARPAPTRRPTAGSQRKAVRRSRGRGDTPPKKPGGSTP